MFRKDHSSYAPGLIAGVDLMSAGKAKLSVCLIDPVRPALAEEPSPRAPAVQGLPSLEELLAYYGARLLRRLFLTHAPGEPLELACCTEIRTALLDADKLCASALALPISDVDAQSLETPLTEAAFNARNPHMLMKSANELAAQFIKAGKITPKGTAALSQLLATLGLAQ